MNEEIKKEKKIRKKGNIIFPLFIMLFCLILGFFSLFGFFVPDREISENENRVLATMPELTVSTVLDGSFMKDFEAYLADQFPLRDGAIYLKSFFERLWGKKQENGVYIGKNDFLFDKPTAFDEEKMIATAKAVKDFCKENKKLKSVFALAPDSTCIYGEYLPEGLIVPDRSEEIGKFYVGLDKDIATVDTVTALNKEKGKHNVFYKTDHHWTTRGAYSVFLEIAKELSLDVKERDFEFHTVANDFEGTLKSKSTFARSEDSVEICLPKKSEGTYYIEIPGADEKYASCFFEDKLKEKNKYEVFLGGNYEKLTITTTLPEGRKLVVIKDSFANCLIPMLTPYFTKIVVLDPRYMTESVQNVLQEDDFTDLLFLYNANTFFSDTSLMGVIE